MQVGLGLTWFGSCLICGQEPGLAPAGDSLSGVPESKQRARPLLPTSLRCATGNLRRQALEAVRPNSLRALGTPFRQTAASQSTKLLHSAVQQPAPRTCRHRRGHKGQYRMRVRDSFSMFLIADSLFNIWTRSQFRHKSRRPPAPASTRLAAPAARGSGCGHWHRRVPMLRLQIYGNVFERRAKLEVSFAVPQPELRDAGLPGAKRRDAGNRVAFFGLRFFGRRPRCEQER